MIREKCLSLHWQKYYYTIMLGIKTRRTPIGGDIANEIRSAVARVANGQLNAQEKASVERAKEALNRYQINWELWNLY